MQAQSEAAAKDAGIILEKVRELAADFAGERRERQQRRELVQADFDRLRDTGFLRTGVPVEHGGIWESLQRSNRAVCEMLRALAHGDSSVALVATMHPSVLQYTGWLSLLEAPHPYREAWDEQRRWAFQMAKDGRQWGTIMSEPGSGGDTSKTKATARQQLQRKRDSMLAYEQTEWARVEIEGWLIQQAYEGMLRAVEQASSGNRETRLGKAAVAEMAESVMLRICKVVGGGSYSRNSPYGFWLEDVRALGFLRPPWGLAFDQIFQGSLDASE